MKLTIITINFNNLEGLKLTFDSVFSQTYKNFEYIVIDGGSNDNSKEYIENNQDKIDYWVSEKDFGIYNAMNKGITKANGEYLLFLNSGDFLYNKTTIDEIILKLDVNCDIIYTNLLVDYSKKKKVFKPPKTLNFTYFIDYSLPHPSSFIKKELFEKYGLYREDLKIVSDWAFFFETIIKIRVKYKYIDHINAVYDYTGLSSKPENEVLVQSEKLKVINELFGNMDFEIKLIKKVKYNKVLKLNEMSNNNSFIWKIIKLLINMGISIKKDNQALFKSIKQ
jgi:glycosyltransferase involved in cell wall biosynthesis